MRAVIRRENVRIEFAGRGQFWNDMLRPYFGGPEAPPEPERPAAPPPAPAARQAPAAAEFAPHRSEAAYQSARPAPMPVTSGAAPRAAAPSQPRTWYPPREHQPQHFEAQRAPAQHYSAEDDGPEAVQVEPSSDPATLYARLAALPGRRSERDAVLAAVWFLTKGEVETTGDDVERHFEALHVFPDVKVVPHLLKHIHRTKMLEPGLGPKAARLSKKGIASVRGRLVPV